jgi:uncharacterized membrane protein HdeD (DUF308 family)
VTAEREEGGPETAASGNPPLLKWRGMSAIAFAALVFFWPHLAAVHLVYLWATYSLVDGLLTWAVAVRGGPGTPRIWLGLMGGAGVACAATALVAPDAVGRYLVLLVSAWAAFTGVLQLWIALKIRAEVERGWVVFVDGVGAVAFGLGLLLCYRFEFEAFVWMLGIFSGMLGALFLLVQAWLDG